MLWVETRDVAKCPTVHRRAMGLELTGVNRQVVIEMEQIPEANCPKVIDHS